MNEARTRRERIDPRLRAAGWTIRAWRDVHHLPLSTLNRCAVTEYPTATGPADYALIAGGRVAAFVEAKRVTTATATVLAQTERYSRGVAEPRSPYAAGGVPYLYATNGYQVYFEDARHAGYRSRELAGFHTPEALAEMAGRDLNAAAAWLRDHPNDHAKLRPYQKAATAAVEEAIAAGKRQMLVAMATGTGKTFTTVSLIYRLLRAGVARRVLFLVDRRALAAQAVQAFGTFEPEPNQKFTALYEVFSQRFRRSDTDDGDAAFDPTEMPAGHLRHPTDAHTFVYVSTIQRMALNLFGAERAAALGGDEDDEAEGDAPLPATDIPIHAFDVVIADECHRGYTAQAESVWRDVLNHFDAIRIGLTATPAAHTVGYFTEKVFEYGYQQAVREGYLVDYDQVNIASGALMRGVFLREGERVGLVDVETGTEQLDRLEDERTYDASQVEREVTAPDSNRKIVREVIAYARAHEEHTGRLPKTLVFATNDQGHTSHADQLVTLFRDELGQGDKLVEKITGKVDDPLGKVKQFRNRPQPAVVVTVDLLSTGVDIPRLEFIVFARPVKSRILWEQMLGRGTRRCEDIAKTHFTIFDCFDGSLARYFEGVSGMSADPPAKPTRTLTAIVEDIYRNRDRDYNVRVLVKRLRRIEREMDGAALDLFAAFIPDGDIGAFAEALPLRVKDEFPATMRLLREPAFLDLCVNYPRRQRVFVRAYDFEDTVTSEVVFRTVDGRALEREDYLTAFAAFVQAHQDDIDAIAVLLGRPRDWDTKHLTELRQRLAATPEQFTEKNLRRAYRQDLADIISMVKRAAREDEALLTGEQRAARAIETVTAGRTLTDDQRAWLDRIERHLAECLTVERDDFDDIPVFADAGGWSRANRAFAGDLADWLNRCNEAMAA